MNTDARALRVAVVTSSPPLTEGGHLVIARTIVETLGALGHEADLVVTPQNRFGRQASSYLATWLTDVGVDGAGERIDHVISMRFPSYAVRHPSHACWLNHTMREYYDLWPRFEATLDPGARLKERIRRRLIHAADRYLFRNNVTRLFVQSRTIQKRLDVLPGVRSTILYPPPPPRPYRCDEYGDYLFAVSRLAPLKRFDLLLRALAQPEARGIRCVLAGEGEERARLGALARELGVADRVQMIGRLDGAGLVERLARCRAVVFIPYDEDYGFVTVEAFAAAKPVITCSDSGGPTELVRDGEHGFVCAPDPTPLARAMRRLMDDAALAGRLGSAGQSVVAGMSWERAVGELLKRP
jgi:glycosyltransferase involved in cell wall biosynthesis